MSRQAQRQIEAHRRRDNYRTDEFGAYVDGRTIAIVGPAPFRDGDIDLALGHDLIYLVSESSWDGPVHIRFASKQNQRDWSRDKRRVTGDWVVLKMGGGGLNTDGIMRSAKYPRPGFNPNQVTAAIMDLDNFAPADVNVYGADLYLGGHESIYRPGYANFTRDKNWQAIMAHRPQEQHGKAREIMLKRGWFSRSTAYLEALELDVDTYWTTLRRNWGMELPAKQGWNA